MPEAHLRFILLYVVTNCTRKYKFTKFSIFSTDLITVTITTPHTTIRTILMVIPQSATAAVAAVTAAMALVAATAAARVWVVPTTIQAITISPTTGTTTPTAGIKIRDPITHTITTMANIRRHTTGQAITKAVVCCKVAPHRHSSAHRHLTWVHKVSNQGRHRHHSRR